MYGIIVKYTPLKFFIVMQPIGLILNSLKRERVDRRERSVCFKLVNHINFPARGRLNESWSVFGLFDSLRSLRASFLKWFEIPLRHSHWFTQCSQHAFSAQGGVATSRQLLMQKCDSQEKIPLYKIDRQELYCGKKGGPYNNYWAIQIYFLYTSKKSPIRRS